MCQRLGRNAGEEILNPWDVFSVQFLNALSKPIIHLNNNTRESKPELKKRTGDKFAVVN